MQKPLAAELRPATLEDFIGQEHLVGPGKPLRAAIESGHRLSCIFWGPPGVGKTTLARIYAASIDAELFELSAVSAGKADVKKIIEAHTGEHQKVLFLDEIHRFNKAQQDFLLPYVERGDLTLIGATTENPSFEVIPALLSRMRVFVLHELSEDDMARIIERASIPMDEEARNLLIRLANGDARQALTLLDNTQRLYGEVTPETLAQAAQSKHLRHDKSGEEHYNLASAFIKSMRASNADAALYYLSRLVEVGEDPKFIARRMVIFASEDVGLAAPTALVVANAVFRAVETIGYPECAINLAHGVAYLAQCKKDRRAYEALRAAQADVKNHGNLPIPLKIRNAPTKLMKNLEYGKDYEPYTDEDLLPDELKGMRYLAP
jgi:putative ATPase